MGEFVKSFGWLGTVAGAMFAAVWAFLTYEDQARIAFQKPIVDRTLELCFAISELTAQMVSDQDPPTWYKARNDFWTYYHGRLVLVESSELSSAMVGYGRAVAAMTPEHHETLGQNALAVSGACRKQIDALMSKGWKLDTGSILNIEAIKIPLNNSNTK